MPLWKRWNSATPPEANWMLEFRQPVHPLQRTCNVTKRWLTGSHAWHGLHKFDLSPLKQSPSLAHLPSVVVRNLQHPSWISMERFQKKDAKQVEARNFLSSRNPSPPGTSWSKAGTFLLVLWNMWFQPGTCLPTSRLWSSMHRTTTSDTWSLAGGTLSRKRLCKAKNTTQHCRGHLFAAAHLAISF